MRKRKKIVKETKLSNIRWISLIYISISLLGLCLLAMLTFTSSLPQTTFPLQKQVSGLIFGVICLLGIIMGTRPSGCSKDIHYKRSHKKKTHSKLLSNERLEFKGHHPTCKHYSTHTISFGNKTYCAGCLGLVVGAVLSLTGVFLYYSMAFFTQEEGLVFFWLGFFGVIFGLLQYYLFKSNFFHFLLNVLFVLGVFFLFIGINIIKNSFIIEFYLLSIIVYWIMTRIRLSQWEHKKVCANCDSTFCEIKGIV